MKLKFSIVLIAFLSHSLFSINKDSLNISKVDKMSKYMIYSPGFVLIKDSMKKAGYAFSSSLDYEIFIIQSLSITGRIGFNYSYIKYSNDAVELYSGASLKKYLRIKNRYFLYFYSAILANSVKINDFQNINSNKFSGIGFTSSTGIGIQILPTLKRKNRIGRFGFDAGYSLLNLYSKLPSPFYTFGLKYRIK